MPTSAPRLYFENALAQLLEHPQGYAVITYKPGKRQVADVQALFGQLGQLLSQHGWHRLLADQRQLSPFTPDESEWIRLHWLPRASQVSGALVLATDVFTRLASSQLVHELPMSSRGYRFFGDDASAVAWLLTQ